MHLLFKLFWHISGYLLLGIHVFPHVQPEKLGGVPQVGFHNLFHGCFYDLFEFLALKNDWLLIVVVSFNELHLRTQSMAPSVALAVSLALAFDNLQSFSS